MAISLYMIYWGVKTPNGLIQFPTLAGAAWAFFFGPEILGILRNPSLIPVRALNDNGLEMALIMCNFCAGLSFIGYLKSPPNKLINKWKTKTKKIFLYHKHIFSAGLILIMISLIGFHKLAGLCGGYLAYFSPKGNYALTWIGLPVAYVFFVMLVYPGLILCLLSAFQKPSFVRWVVISIGLIIPILRVVILGRRTDFVVIGLTILFTRFFITKKIPSKKILGCFILISFVWVAIAPEYRTYTAIEGDFYKISEINISESISSIFSGNDKSRNHFLINTYEIPVVQKEAAFGLGRNFYNQIIHGLVPALIFGREFKNSLFLNTPNITLLTWQHYRYTRELWLIWNRPE